MSGRGAGSSGRVDRQFELVPAPSFARRLVAVARQLLGRGLDAGQVCSLFLDVAQVLSKQRRGFTREEFLTLCAELYDRGEVEQEVVTSGVRLTARGGSA